MLLNCKGGGEQASLRSPWPGAALGLPSGSPMQTPCTAVLKPGWAQAEPRALPVDGREREALPRGTGVSLHWSMPLGLCGCFLLTPCLFFSGQVVLKGDARKLQLYGVSVLGQHVGGPSR